MAKDTSQELAVKEEETSTAVAVAEDISAEEAALIAANQDEVDATEFVIPHLKLAQALTEEVTSGLARPGEFVLPLTGESFTAPVEFIVAAKAKGRFKPGRDGERTLTAYNETNVPEHWDPDPFVGKPFAEHPDAEEQYAARVNAKEHDWGSGPPIQTSYVYTGFLVGSEVPVRLSLRSTNVPAAKKWNTLLDAVLRGRYWDKKFVLQTEQQKNAKGAYFTIVPQIGAVTTPEEKQAAIKLAVALRNQAVQIVGEEGDSPLVEPDSEGGLEV